MERDSMGTWQRGHRRELPRSRDSRRAANSSREKISRFVMAETDRPSAS